MEGNKVAIKDLARVERPREKLSRYGQERLSDTELLAVILRTGRKGENVLALASRLLKKNGLPGLAQLNLQQLKNMSGIGQVKACGLLACFELGRRIFSGKKTELRQMLSPGDVFESLKDIRESRKEHFVVFYLDSRNQQIRREIVSVGTINSSLVHPREVFEGAVKYLATNVIVAHNHPSGELRASEKDIAVTQRLRDSGSLLGIELLDHIIVSKEGYISLREENICSFTD
ncbi:MAG: DNA repair protein RadC [Candidatus Omnitrophota bacterium]|jgi:DNA repair protein RadC